jgi:hypothetical protein
MMNLILDGEGQMAWKYENKSLLDLASAMGNALPGSIEHTLASAEFQRRQTKAQIAAANYMFYSVIAIAVTSGINALFVFLEWYAPHLPK